jgi:hypothetical protein
MFAAIARKRSWMFVAGSLIVLPAIAVGTSNARAQQESAGAKISLPPMGWSSWNSFSNTINSDVARSQAEAMAKTGLKKAGYEYVNIDEGWWLGERDAQGNIVVDPKAWPALAPAERAGDMSNIVRFIHSLGLKAGIYTDAGKDGCSMFPDLGPAYFNTGSEGHYDQDFLQFARWGFDYVKVDWCGGNKENLDPQQQYGEIARAIAQAEQITGRQLYFSICNWGKESPWTWAPGVDGATQSIWRTSGDIVAPVVASGEHSGRKVAFEKMLSNFDAGVHPEAEHTGFYNDPDMMVLGMPGLNADQNRLHMALWVMSGAPLLIGADLTRPDAGTLATLTNPEAIRIDQDALGLQAVKVQELAHGLEVWSKFLSTPGERAVLLLNRTYFPAPMSVKWADLGLAGETATVRDVWAAKDLGATSDAYNATVPAQGGVLLLVKGSEVGAKHYSPAPNETKADKAVGEMETRFTAVVGQRRDRGNEWAQVRITYRNPGATSQLADLTVNAQGTTRVAFPPAGTDASSVWVQVRLQRTGADNTLRFVSPCCGSNLAIQGIDVY